MTLAALPIQENHRSKAIKVDSCDKHHAYCLELNVDECETNVIFFLRVCLYH